MNTRVRITAEFTVDLDDKEPVEELTIQLKEALGKTFKPYQKTDECSWAISKPEIKVEKLVLGINKPWEWQEIETEEKEI